MNRNYLLLFGSLLAMDGRCVLENIYAPCDSKEKQVLWDEILAFKRLSPLPWCLSGDFNAVRCEEEKSGMACFFMALDWCYYWTDADWMSAYGLSGEESLGWDSIFIFFVVG